jgi:hypothetical protein
MASIARRSSLRPESFENSVAPMPAIAARSPISLRNRPPGDADDAPADRLDPPGQAHLVARVVRRPQTDVDAAQPGLGTGPVGHEAADVAVGGEDVHEDVARAAGDRQLAIVVHVLEIPRRDRTGDDAGGRDRQRERRELVARRDLALAQGPGRPHQASARTSSLTSREPSFASCCISPPKSSSFCFAHRK